MLDLFEELVALIHALESRRIDYAVCGGLAMAIWGLPRATVDIDLLIERESLASVEEVAASLGYTFKANPSVVSRSGLVKLNSFRASGTDLDDIERLQEDT